MNSLNVEFIMCLVFCVWYLVKHFAHVPSCYTTNHQTPNTKYSRKPVVFRHFTRLPRLKNEDLISIEWTHKRKNSHYISMIR
ncbi:hypothetical protein D1AOALGA4SA_1348 [Olavius algarvensis Delta 1 endosymbiont]|nr:hypothetical protein D1AOALGA4SA_1348 [Olavius algarvensis Delta 1 endosymbiont]